MSFQFLIGAMTALWAARVPIYESDEESTQAPGAETIEVDRARGEVRFPCLFVNPERLIEVFACYKSGPTHETVVKFDVSGPAIYRALLEAGCRNASYWNGTSPDDFSKNQGDRLLVLVRWKYLGEETELPAEAMLLEGETGFSSFVRGFSFSARGAQRSADGEPTSGIPVSVEVTLGATQRERPSYSLLSHPTNSARVEPWMLPPQIDTRALDHHRELVEEGVPATLILRRVRSETDLIAYARSAAQKAGLTDRLLLYDRLLPIAREIDALKGEYEGLLVSIRKLLSQNDVEKERTVEEKKALEAEGKGLLRRGHWLCTRIEERYLTWFSLEEEFKASWIEKRSELPAEVRQEALYLTRDGFLFEPKIAAKEVEIAALDLSGEGESAADRKILREALQKEIEALMLERTRRRAEAQLRVVESRLHETEASDPYTSRLFQEDKLQLGAMLRSLRIKARIVAGEITERRRASWGSGIQRKERILRERSLDREELDIIKLEEELLKGLEDIRWLENDLESNIPERSQNAKRALQEAQKKKAELEKKIDEAKRALEKKRAQGKG